jgi:hypothetical protein
MKSLVQVDIREVIKVCEQTINLIIEERIYRDKQSISNFKIAHQNSIGYAFREMLELPHLTDEQIHSRLIKEQRERWYCSYPSFVYSDVEENAITCMRALKKAISVNKDSFKTQVQMSVSEFSSLIKTCEVLEEHKKSRNIALTE